MRESAQIVRRLRSAPKTTPGLREERRKVSREVAAWDRTAVLALAHEAMSAGVARFVAYELVRYHDGVLNGLTRAEVERLGAEMHGWAEIDAFGVYVAGPAWRIGRLADGDVERWARSKDWRWRRAALVATVPLNVRSQGGEEDATRTLGICRMLAGDREDLVMKAVSWALRALAVRAPASVRRFLADERGQLAARVMREVDNKLKTGKKNSRSVRARDKMREEPLP